MRAAPAARAAPTAASTDDASPAGRPAARAAAATAAGGRAAASPGTPTAQSRSATPAAVILGIAGTTLAPEEAALFRRHRPAGAILFARNVADPAQLRSLTASLREVLGAEAPILVDQEGGRVARLRPPQMAIAILGLAALFARALTL